VGLDDISLGLLKCAKEQISIALHTLFAKVWIICKVPADSRDAIIVSLYKGICADKAGVNVRQSIFTDIDYAADAVLFAEDDAQWTSILESFDTAANTMGLHTSWAKTKIQNVASGPSPPSCVISGHQVEVVSRLTYSVVM